MSLHGSAGRYTVSSASPPATGRLLYRFVRVRPTKGTGHCGEKVGNRTARPPSTALSWSARRMSSSGQGDGVQDRRRANPSPGLWWWLVIMLARPLRAARALWSRALESPEFHLLAAIVLLAPVLALMMTVVGYSVITVVPRWLALSALWGWSLWSARPRAFLSYNSRVDSIQVEVGVAENALKRDAPFHGWAWDDVHALYLRWALPPVPVPRHAKSVLKPLIAVAAFIVPVLLIAAVIPVLAVRAGQNPSPETGVAVDLPTMVSRLDQLWWFLAVAPTWSGLVASLARATIRNAWKREVWLELTSREPGPVITRDATDIVPVSNDLPNPAPSASATDDPEGIAGKRGKDAPGLGSTHHDRAATKNESNLTRALQQIGRLGVFVVGIATVGAWLLPNPFNFVPTPKGRPSELPGEECLYDVEADRDEGAITVDIKRGGHIVQPLDVAEGVTIARLQAIVGMHEMLANTKTPSEVTFEVWEDDVEIRSSSELTQGFAQEVSVIVDPITVRPGSEYSLVLRNTSGQTLSPYVQPHPSEVDALWAETSDSDPVRVEGSLSGAVCTSG